MATLIPVNPALDNQGRIRVLVPMLGPNAVPYPPKRTDLDWDAAGKEIRVYNRQSSVEAAAKLGIADIFRASASGFYQVCVIDYTVGVLRVRTGNVAPGTVWGTLWGAAVRVALRVESLDASIAADAGIVAASTELGLARVEYAVTAIGVGRKEFAAMLRGVPPLGTFNYSAFAQLDGCFRALCGSLIGTLTRDQAQPVAVLLASDPMQDTTMIEARAMRWCAIQLAHSIPLNEAKSHKPPWLGDDQVDKCYSAFGVSSGTAAIDDSVRSKAQIWLGGDL